MIATELDRLKKAKTDIKAAIEAKGVQVAPEALLDSYPAKIGEIQTGKSEIELDWSGTHYETNDIKIGENYLQGEMQKIVDYTAQKYNEWDPAATSGHNSFLGDTQLEMIPAINIENVIRAEGMFERCSNVVIVPELNALRATNTKHMFHMCSSIIVFPPINTPSAVDMTGMFSFCDKLTKVPVLNTSKAEVLKQLFMKCGSLVSIPTIDVSSANDLSQMFSGCFSLKEIHLTGTPKSGSNVQYMFDEIAAGGTLYIPTGKTAEYKKIIDQLPSTWSVVEE